MAVVINYKICDNSKDCDGIKGCPVGAFKWDEENKTIYVDNDICIDCGVCENSCTVNALKVTTNKEEYDKAVKVVEDDTRTIQDLFCERFGASPMQQEFLLEENQFNQDVLNLKRPLMVELFNDDSIMCLLKSIPIKELLAIYDKDATFLKVKVVEGDIMKKYGITELPALLFFKDGLLLEKEEGFVEDENRKELLDKVKKILN